MDKLTTKIKTIISHEYVSKVKAKSFILSTLLGPLAFVLLIGISVAAQLLTKGETERKLAIVDQYGGIGEQLVARDTTKYFISFDEIKELDDQIISGDLDGYVVIPADIIDNGVVTLNGKGGGGLGLTEALEKNLGKIVRKERLVKFGADPKVIALVESGISIESNKVTEKGKERDETQVMAMVGYGFGFVIYFLMIIYGGWISRSVIEEKANRIIEVIVSSAKPFDILLGKVLAVAMVGLTQVAIWVVLGFLILSASGIIIGNFVEIDPAALQQGMTVDQAQQEKVQEVMAKLPSISWTLIAGFVFYFISGYLIYATLFAALGSAVDHEQDAAQLQTPLTLFIILPILLIQSIISNPDGTFAVALSLFPLFSPILMIARIGSTTVPLWQIALSVVLMVGSFFGALWVASRIYRIGILMTGKKPSFKELIKWLSM